MAELSRRSEVSVATIKYYLREGLLPPGERIRVNQAEYDEGHVTRLRLVRALIDLAGLPMAEVREVLAVLDARSSVVDVLAAVQDSLAGPERDEGEEGSEGDWAAERVRRVIAERGWAVGLDSPAFWAAVAAVRSLESAGVGRVAAHLAEYAEAAEIVGRVDVDTLVDEAVSALNQSAPAGGDAHHLAAHEALVGTLLRRPLLDALVMLAQQHRTQHRLES